MTPWRLFPAECLRLRQAWTTVTASGPLLPQRLFFYGSYFAPGQDRDNKATAYGPVKRYRSRRDEAFGKLTFAPTDRLLFNGSYRTSTRMGQGVSVGFYEADSVSVGERSEQDILSLDGSWQIDAATTLAFQYFDYALRGSERPDVRLSVVPRLDVTLDRELFIGAARHSLHAGFRWAKGRESLRRASNGWGVLQVPGGVDQAADGTPIFYTAAVEQMSLAQGDGTLVGPIRSAVESYSIELNDRITLSRFTYNLGVLISQDVLYGQGLRRVAGSYSGFELSPGTKYRMRTIPWADMIQPRLSLAWAYHDGGEATLSFARYHPQANSLARAASWDRNARASLIGGSSYVIAQLDGAYTKYWEAVVELEWRGERGYLNASYVRSRYTGNFDQDNTSSVNDANRFIGSSLLADGYGRQLWDRKDGVLRGDRPHVFKAFGHYALPWRAQLGAYLIYQSGQPWEAWDATAYGLPFYFSAANRYAERAGRRRSPNHWQLDLSYAQRFNLFRDTSAQVRVDVFNVFDRQTGYNINPFVNDAGFGEARRHFMPRRVQVSVGVAL